MLSSVVAGYNRALWPAQLLAYGLALALLWRTLCPPAGGSHGGARLAGILLAAAWAWTGVAFHLRAFAAINFIAPLYAALFLVQALLLVRAAIVRGEPAPRPSDRRIGRAGMAAVAYAVAGYPLIAAIAGEGLASARVVGLAPGPTAVFTLGLLLLADARLPRHLALVPVLWCLIEGVSAWMLGVPEDLALPFLGLASLALIFGRSRHRPAR